MTMPSPYGSTPGGADYGYGETASPSPTPSPGWYPQRPATRAAYTHYRHASTGFNDGPGDRGHPPPPPNFSPRYRSDGSYGTVPVSPSYIVPAVSTSRRRSSRHRHDGERRQQQHGHVGERDGGGREGGGDRIHVYHHHQNHNHRRTRSSSHQRPSFYPGDADEAAYQHRSESKSSGRRRRASSSYATRVVYEVHTPSRRDTDYYRYYEQGGFSQSQQQQQQPPPPPHQQPHQSPRGYESPSPHRGPGGYESPRHEPVQPDYHRRGESPSARQREEEMRRQHMRRSSAAAGIPPPIRPQTARPVMHKSGGIPRPGSSHKKPTAAAATPVNKRKATEKDAEKWKIPLGYSLKNWDPDETPMLLLGSVFDANSLGKWIYDWTVFHQGPATPIAEMAGELWLLLIQVSGKTKRAEEGVTQVRRKESAELIEDFIASGHRLMDRLKKLLKACEQPMLKANRTKKDKALGKSAGVEFVETLFGRDRELERTEKFMQAARVWEFRFDANCEEILKNPKK